MIAPNSIPSMQYKHDNAGCNGGDVRRHADRPHSAPQRPLGVLPDRHPSDTVPEHTVTPTMLHNSVSSSPTNLMLVARFVELTVALLLRSHGYLHVPLSDGGSHRRRALRRVTGLMMIAMMSIMSPRKNSIRTGVMAAMLTDAASWLRLRLLHDSEQILARQQRAPRWPAMSTSCICDDPDVLSRSMKKTLATSTRRAHQSRLWLSGRHTVPSFAFMALPSACAHTSAAALGFAAILALLWPVALASALRRLTWSAAMSGRTSHYDNDHPTARARTPMQSGLHGDPDSKLPEMVTTIDANCSHQYVQWSA